MSSLRDQLLKAGLVTEDQVKKAETKPKRNNHKKAVNKPNTRNQQSTKPSKPKKELSDLEKFYRERSSAENKERQQAKKEKEIAAQLKKERGAKISKLVNENTLNVENATERYNFVVGTTVKYTYVTEEQLEKLAKGELALTFLKGKCRVISTETAKQIKEIDAKRLVVQQEPE